MSFDEVVRREVKRHSRLEVLAPLAECECQTVESFDVQARSGIQAFNVACVSAKQIGIASDRVFADTDKL